MASGAWIALAAAWIACGSRFLFVRTRRSDVPTQGGDAKAAAADAEHWRFVRPVIDASVVITGIPWIVALFTGEPVGVVAFWVLCWPVMTYVLVMVYLIPIAYARALRARRNA